MTTLGLNVLAQTVTDRQALEYWIAHQQARAVLIMDDPALAAALAWKYPALLVIHRAWRADDASLHLTMTPQAFIDSVRDIGRRGVVVQALNEPAENDTLPRLAVWCADVMRLAAAAGIRLALPNFAVGNPTEEAIRRGRLDALVTAFGRHRGHLLAVHEYFQQSAVDEPWHVGRVSTLLSRFDMLRIPRPITIITEAGRDIGGGRGDGWRDTGWGEGRYADLLINMAAMHEVRAGAYAALVFGYGRGFGDHWQSFNVEGAGDVLRRMAEHNAVVRRGDTGWRTAIVRSPVRLRQLPSTHSPTVQVLPLAPGTRITRSAATIRREGWTWTELEGGGWVAVEAGRLSS